MEILSAPHVTKQIFHMYPTRGDKTSEVKHGVCHFRLGSNMGAEYTSMLREKAWYDCKRSEAILMAIDVLHGMTREQAESIIDGKHKLITADDQVNMEMVEDNWEHPDFESMKKEIHEVFQYVGFERGECSYHRNIVFQNWSQMLSESDQLSMHYEAQAIKDIMEYNVWKAYYMSKNLKKYAEHLMQENSYRFKLKLAAKESKFDRGCGSAEDSQEMQIAQKVLGDLEKESISMIATSDMPEEMKRRLIMVAKGQSDARKFGVNIVEDKEFKFDSGWVNPKGIYYGCRTGQHQELSEKLANIHYADDESEKYNYERRLEKKGWIKVSGGLWYSSDAHPTIDQICTIQLWAQKWGEPITWNGDKRTIKDIQKEYAEVE